MAKYVSDIPELAREWHPTKNGDLMPEDVPLNSHKKVWWMCLSGHEWQETVVNRARGTGCPYDSLKLPIKGCNDLATTNPELAREWHPTKNGDLMPEDVTINSHKKVWWKCSKGHEWQATVEQISKGASCPFCNEVRLARRTINLLVAKGQLKSQMRADKLRKK